MAVKKKVVRKKATKKKTAKKKTSTSRRNSTTPINTPEKYVFGRPSEYKRDYPQKVFDACKEGECLTIASICVLLDIDRDTYYQWCRKHPDFSSAIKRGLEHRKLHMEKKGLLGTTMGKQFNGIPWLFLMKNMFPDEYKDKQEVKVEENEKDKPLKRFPYNFALHPDDLDKESKKED